MNENENIQKKPARQKYYRAPLYIAASVFLGSALLFGGWKCFFDTTLDGSWGLKLTVPDSEEEINYNFSFDGNGGMKYHAGGQTAIGKYYTGTENGKPLLTIYMVNGSEPFTAKFNYSFDGNIFSGRKLDLVDLSGFYFTADTKDSDEKTVEAKKKFTDSVTEDGITYYKWTLVPAEPVIKQNKPEGFTPDKDILGTWYYSAEDPSNSYTFTFNDDGTFEQYNSTNEILGSYTISDGKVNVSYYNIANIEMSGELDYSLKDGKLTMCSHEFAKTDNKYAFKTDIK